MKWPTASLDELCDINVGRTPARANPDFWGEGAPWLSIADMNQGRVIRRTKEQITPSAAASGRVVEPGTVLLSFKLSIGKVALAGRPLFTNEAIAALPIHRHDLLEPAFLARALEAVDLSGGSNRAAMGATLNKAKLKQIRIPLPPLDEQRRIAAILDHADALRAKRRQVLAHLDTLTQSIFHEMFGDLAPTTRLGEVVTDLEGGRSLVGNDAAAGAAYRVLKISSVTTGWFRPNESKPLPPDYQPPQKHVVRPGDLLFSRANTTDLVGAVAIVDSEYPNLVLPDKLWRFVWTDPDAVQASFVRELFRTPGVRRKLSSISSGTGGSMKNISKAKLLQMRVSWAPPSAQHDFQTHVMAVTCQRASIQRLMAQDDELFASLQSRAFRGEL